MLEIKTFMAKTVRKREANLEYHELAFAKGKRTVHGQRGYQIQQAHPSDDIPWRVT